MATIAHSVLTTTELHEPKGVSSASLGQVYVADGNGSGNWAGVGTSSFTGMISDFVWPAVQDGWLECDGTDINTTTYGALYDVMTIQMNGTRIIDTATITSLSSTSNMRVGYYVFGVGINSGTTISSIDSGTQITLSSNVSSSGTSQVVVSPWLLNTGTIRLPDLSAAGRYRRSRSSSTSVGQLQATANLAHTHEVIGTTGTESTSHSHAYSGTTSTNNVGHSHSGGVTDQTSTLVNNGADKGVVQTISIGSTGGENTAHTHSYSGQSGVQNISHTHSMSFTSGSTGSTESRPNSIVVMTCVKT